MQSLFIGLGAVVASALPWMLTNWFGVAGEHAGADAIPPTVRLSFYIGAAAFFGAVLYTILTTKEYPPEDMAAFQREEGRAAGIAASAREIFAAIARDAGRPCASWPGADLHLARAVLHVALLPGRGGAQRVRRAGRDLAALPRRASSGRASASACTRPCASRSRSSCRSWRARSGADATHSLCLLAGAAGPALGGGDPRPKLLLLSMVGVGIAWASTSRCPTRSSPARCPPDKTGVYMGIFNFFIVIPEIIASLGFGWVMNHLLGQQPAGGRGGGRRLSDRWRRC